MCGICGILTDHKDDLLPLALDLAETLYYRGHDSVGVGLIDPDTLEMTRDIRVREKGGKSKPVDTSFRGDVERRGEEINPRLALVQTKFTTDEFSDDPEKVRVNSQPLKLVYPVNTPFKNAMGVHNGELVKELLQDDIREPSFSRARVDTRYGIEWFHQTISDTGDIWKAAEQAMKTFVGAGMWGYSDGNRLFFFSQPDGIRPGWVGYKKGKHGDVHVVCSEDGFFGQLGIETKGQIRGGEAVLLEPGKAPERRQLVEAEEAPCWFEPHYLQRSFSTTMEGGMSNSRFRREVGKAVAGLYKDALSEYQLVFHSPNSGLSFMQGVVDVLPYKEWDTTVCWKPGTDERNYLISKTEKRHRFAFCEADIRGKDGIVVEDSLISGDSIVRMYLDWKRYGGRRLVALSASPPMLFSCRFGIRFPEGEELIARGALDNGIAAMTNGEASYTVGEMNGYVTDRLREKISKEALMYGIDVDPGDFSVLYAPIRIIRDSAGKISRSGIACDFCITGRRVDYRRDQPFAKNV